MDQKPSFTVELITTSQFKKVDLVIPYTLLSQLSHDAEYDIYNFYAIFDTEIKPKLEDILYKAEPTATVTFKLNAFNTHLRGVTVAMTRPVSRTTILEPHCRMGTIYYRRYDKSQVMLSLLKPL